MTGSSASIKTNFTAGQVSQNLLGRGDLKIYENGARHLENVIIHPTGGVSRRRGLKYISQTDKPARLIPFEFNTEQIYLLCLTDNQLQVFKQDECIAALETPWSGEQLFQLNYTQSADTLLVVHPDVAPKQITRNNNEVWEISDWEYYTKDNMIYMPFYNFYQRKPQIWASNTGGNITMAATADVWLSTHVNSYLRYQGGLIKITEVITPRDIKGTVVKGLSGTGKTSDWTEAAFSDARGWPVSVTFHQNRMVIGGSRDLPNRLWMSKSSDLFNFDLGKALDDDAIEFGILSDQVNAIKAVVSTRHLLVFTTGAEWMVSGEPLTPEKIQLKRQTSVGIYADKILAPQQIDGATIFVSANGRQLREFLYTDVEQAYQAKDLTILANDIIRRPRDVDYDKNDCVIYLVLEDGTVSCLTTYRTEDVNAWSRLKTQGEFLSVAVIGSDIYFCVKRNNGYFIEKITDDYYSDCSICLTSEEPLREWDGLSHLEGEEVVVLANGFSVGKFVVSEGKINLLEEATEIIAGLPYEHLIEPLPYMVNGEQPYPPKGFRVIGARFRIIDSKSFCIDIGSGYFLYPLKRIHRDAIFDSPPMTYSGDVQIRALGWIRDMNRPMWRIKSDEPLAFTLLSAVAEIKLKE